MNVFVEGNYFYIIENGVTYSGHAKDVKITPKGDGTYCIQGVHGFSECKIVSIDYIKDGLGGDFTEETFAEFYNYNTGGAGSITTNQTTTDCDPALPLGVLTNW